jgi:hypothetical protein
MTPCPPPDDLVRLVDGDLAAARVAALGRHLAACRACHARRGAYQTLVARIGAPLPDGAAARVAARVRARLDEAPPAARRWPTGWLALAGAATLAAAATLLVLAPRPIEAPAPALQARGGVAARPWQDRVAVQVHRLDPDFADLAAGSRVAAGGALVASVRNGNHEPALHLLLFAVDRAAEVHWLYPAWLDATTDPEAYPVPHAPVDTLLDEAVVLDAPAPGPLTLIWIVTPAPLRVSDVERLAPVDRHPDALRRRWPGAVVGAVTVEVGPSPPAAGDLP